MVFSAVAFAFEVGRLTPESEYRDKRIFSTGCASKRADNYGKEERN